MRGSIRPRRLSSKYGSRKVWDVIVDLPRGEDGKRRQQWFRGLPSKMQAEQKLAETLAALDQGTFIRPSQETLSMFLKRYLIHAKTRIRPRTLERYQELVERHIASRIGGVPLSSLRPAHVQLVVDEMLAQNLAPRTVLQAYRVLSGALRQAVRWQEIAVNPAAAVDPPRPERPTLHVPNRETVGRIIQEAKSANLHVPVVLAATTGLRRGELLALKWATVDLETGVLRVVMTIQRDGKRVRFAQPKSQRARRTVGLPALARDVLREQRRQQAERRLQHGPAWQDLDLVIDRGDGGPVHPDSLSSAFARMTRRIGLRDVRFHNLRHAFATALLLKGVHPKVASEVLGHASTGFTMDVYQHLLPSMAEEAAKAIQDTFGATSGGGKPTPG
jgi:integrase